MGEESRSVADVPEKSLGDSGIASGAAASLHGVSGPRPTATCSKEILPRERQSQSTLRGRSDGRSGVVLRDKLARNPLNLGQFWL